MDKPQEFPDFQLIFESSPGLQIVVTPAHPFFIVGVSQSLLHALHRDRSELIGKSVLELFEDRVVTSDLRLSFERVLTLKASENMWVQKYRFKDPNTGNFEEHHWNPINYPVLNAQGKVQYILHRITEITDYNRLQESLRLFVENSLDAVVGMDSDGYITEWNWQAEKTFGWTKTEAIGLRMSDTIIPPIHREAHERGLKHFLKTGRGPVLNKRLELNALTKSGEEICVELSITCVQNKRSTQFFGVLRDISERKKIFEDLKVAKEAAESANYAKSAFLANMSHEIRTPLGVVLGLSELLTEEQIEPKEKDRFVYAIRRNGEMLTNLINDILDLSKIEAEKIKIETQDLPVADILYDLESLLSVKASEKGLHFAIRKDVGIPENIKTDPLRFKQILFNIVGNAIKFTERGFVSIYVTLENGKFCVCVSDSGIGIDTSDTSKLFKVFSQADSSFKRQFGGTGLGLVISKQLAQLLGGDVILEKTNKGQGSTFRISIDPGPLQPKEVGEEKSPPIHEPIEEVKPVQSLKGMKILLVDDAIDNQILVSHLIKLAGAHVTTASNGKAAVDLALSKKFDVILMDLQMPIMDGYEAKDLLRHRGYRGPIVALTAHASSKDRDYCLSHGFDGHIGKPIQRASLLQGLSEIFQTTTGPSNPSTESAGAEI